MIVVTISGGGKEGEAWLRRALASFHGSPYRLSSSVRPQESGCEVWLDFRYCFRGKLDWVRDWPPLYRRIQALGGRIETADDLGEKRRPIIVDTLRAA